MKTLSLACALAIGGLAVATQEPKVTYDDTPQLPDSAYKVHGERPVPRVVSPGAQPGQAPSDAIVLFDGTDLARWKGNKGDARWKVVGDYVEVNGTGGITTRDEFGDMQLHLEFCSPADVQGNSQGRGNSGVFLMGRYEIQVLDSFENPSYPDGQCSAMYGQWPPLVNACRKPGEWQTFDILFRAPRFADDGSVTSPARVTVLHNGVVTHADQPFLGGTTHRQVASYAVHPSTGPIQLQDHGNPVRYRNIWVRPLGEYDQD